MYEQIRYEVEEPIATLTLHCPERLNALTERMGQEIIRALAAAEKNPRVAVIVLTGEGRSFCVSEDFQGLASPAHGERASARPGARRGTDSSTATTGPLLKGTFIDAMAIAKPIVGAVNGPCVGLGILLALGCDVRFASDRASFSTAFARGGLTAEWGICWTLPRLVGAANALDLLLSARTIDAAHAARIGLVNRVVSHEKLLEATRVYARDIAKNCASRPVAVIKREVLQHLAMPFERVKQETTKDVIENLYPPGLYPQ